MEASRSVKISYVHIARDAVSLAVTPQNILIEPSDIRLRTADVIVDLYEGGRRLESSAFSCSALGDGLSLPNGLNVNSLTDSDGRFHYHLIFNGDYKETSVELPFKVVYRDTAYESKVSIRIVSDGKNGIPGVPSLPPRLWEDYPEGYTFQNGKNGAEWLDVVLIMSAKGACMAYSCKQNHVKAEDKRPDNEIYWQHVDAGTFKLLATEVFLARESIIKNLLAERILMVDADGNILFKAKDGEVECNIGKFRNVEVEGKVMAGVADGKRVELDPTSKAISIFDDSGRECATLDGSEYTTESVMPEGESYLQISPSEGVKINSYAIGINGVSNSEDATILSELKSSSSQLTLTVDAKLDINNPDFPDINDPETGELLPNPISRSFSQVSCIIKTYNAAGVIINEILWNILGLRPYLDDNQQLQDITYKGTFSRTFNLLPGRHQVCFKVYAAYCEGIANCKITLAKIFQESFISRYFSNGFALVRNTDDYLLAMYESGKMKLMLGGEFFCDGVRQPKVLYSARVTDKSSFHYDPCTTLVVSQLPGTSVVAQKQLATGVYQFAFPPAYGLNIDNTIVQVSGYSWIAGDSSRPAKASVRDIWQDSGKTYIEVWVSDDDTPNYGGFYIEVKSI